MNTFQRPLVNDLVRLLTDELPPRIVAVTGPRQSGKTTLVRQARRRLRACGLSGQLSSAWSGEPLRCRILTSSDPLAS